MSYQPPRTRWFLTAVLLLTACRGPSPETAVTPSDGIYEFTASTGEAQPLRGALTVVAGSLGLRPEFGTCRIDHAYASSERTRYLCDHNSEIDQLAFLIDNRAPLIRSTWAGRVRQRRTRTVCAQYATQNGRQVCVQQRTETYEVVVPVSGRLIFRTRPTA